jgi:hypothetical protein
MIVPASAVSFVFIQWSIDQCAIVGIGRLFFQLASGCNWLWQVRHGNGSGKPLDLVIIPKRCSRIEGGISKSIKPKEFAKRHHGTPAEKRD